MEQQTSTLGQFTQEGTLRKKEHRDLKKNCFAQIYTAENGTNTSIWVSETLHAIDFPHLGKESKYKAYISKPFENMDEVNLVVKSFKSIPAKTRSILHLIPLKRKTLTFLQRIKYYIFHYYVVSENYNNVDRVTNPGLRQKDFLELASSLQPKENSGVARIMDLNKTD